MTEGNYSWSLIELILHGGLISLGFHVIAFGVAAYVSARAFVAVRRRKQLPTVRLVCLSFLPLVLVSLVIFLHLFLVAGFTGGGFHVWEFGSIELPPSPSAFDMGSLESRRESTARTIARMKLYLYAGWRWTGLSPLAVYAASRRCERGSEPR